MELSSNITLLETPHRGKAFALNEGLKHVKTAYTITVDSDTVLHPCAIRNIMYKLTNSNDKIVATAGCLFAKNAIAFTEVPETLTSLGRQRKRWLEVW